MSAVENELEYVGFWPRVGASLIDTILLMCLTAPILGLVYGMDYWLKDGPLVRGPADFVISWVLPAVVTILFWQRVQATPGKMAVSARIVDAETGEPASTIQLVFRYVGYLVSTLPLMLGFIWIAFDPRKQGWHDKLANTVVIRPTGHGPLPVRFDR